MWIADNVKIRREVDVSTLLPVPVQRDYNLISLNHAFLEVEVTEAEAVEVVEDEAILLQELEAARDDDQAIVNLLDIRYEDLSNTAHLDAGMAGIVAALTAKGAFTISSCNGGVLGDSHLSDVPHVLFACNRDLLASIEGAAAAVGCGLVDNDGYVELFADDLRKMNRIATALLGVDAAAPSVSQ
jgi:hypothetical protein